MTIPPSKNVLLKAIVASSIVALLVILLVRQPALPSGSQARDEAKTPRVSEFDQIYMGKQSVLKKLRDPKSAEFSDIRLGPVQSERTGGGAVCGYVNSKNGFGGYSGRERFLAVGDLAYLESGTANGFDGIWERLCGSQ